MPKDLGKPYKHDPEFKGPISKRSCTDVLCLVIFVCFIVSWITIGILAIKNGDISTLLSPKDSQGNRCGYDPGYEKRPYLYFFDLTKCAAPNVPIIGCKTPQVCVDKCPNDIFIYQTESQTSGVATIRNKLICVDSFDKRKLTSMTLIQNAIDNNLCSAWYLPSNPIFKYCIPSPNVNETIIQQAINNNDISSFWEGIKNIKQLNELSQAGHEIVEDVVQSKWEIVIGLVIGTILCILFIWLMRFFAGCMVWISLFGAVALLAVGLYFGVVNYIELKNHPDENHTGKIKVGGTTWDTKLNTKDGWLALAIISGILLAVILLIILALRKRILIAIAVIEEASKAVASATSALFFPLAPWVLHLVVLFFAVVIALYLIAIGNQPFYIKGMNKTGADCICDPELQYTVEGKICNPQIFDAKCHSRTNQKCVNVVCDYTSIFSPNSTGYFHAVNAVGFIWSMFFVSALGEMILAGVFATWYWTRPKSKVPFFILTKSTYRTIRYHLGTLAFGSLILTICRIIRIILEYIHHKCQKFDNACTKCILWFFRCFFWCLENFLRFLNKNAYIMCAIHGKNFCRSAKDAANLLLRNVLRVFVIDNVSSFLLFLGKIMVVAANTALAYVLFASSYTFLEVPSLHYNLVPVIIIGIGTYFITCIFFGVYEMAINTIFLCFLEDCERNDGSPEKPYFMSQNLMKILGRKNVR